VVTPFAGGHHALGVTAPTIFFFDSGYAGLGRRYFTMQTELVGQRP